MSRTMRADGNRDAAAGYAPNFAAAAEDEDGPHTRLKTLTVEAISRRLLSASDLIASFAA